MSMILVVYGVAGGKIKKNSFQYETMNKTERNHAKIDEEALV